MINYQESITEFLKYFKEIIKVIDFSNKNIYIYEIYNFILK